MSRYAYTAMTLGRPEPSVEICLVGDLIPLRLDRGAQLAGGVLRNVLELEGTIFKGDILGRNIAVRPADRRYGNKLVVELKIGRAALRCGTAGFADKQLHQLEMTTNAAG